ncbi:MAG: hypothetical protein AAGG09_11610 [Pseudomonadota bacterium]
MYRKLLRSRVLATLFDSWGYFGLERLLDSIEAQIRLLILLLILSILISVLLFLISLVLSA